MRVWRLFTPIVLLSIMLLGMSWTVRPISAIDWEQKVDPVLLNLQRAESAEFLIILDQQADLSHIPDHWTKEQKGQAVYDALTTIAHETQPAVLAQLGRAQLDAQPFWITNMILVRGDSALIERMARRPDIQRITNNTPIYLEPPHPADTVNRTPTAIEWGIDKINAPAVWELGYTGQNVIIAGQDTGYDWDHPSVKAQYRGWDGSTADHDYSWHDSIHSSTGVCGADSAEPCDDHGHGTHTIGTMVGNDLAATDANWPAGASNAIGVAPGAKWIGCRNMNGGWGTPTTYAECYQWFIAPTDVAGNNPDPSKAPHVINNSWHCPAVEGCTSLDVFLTLVQSIHAAGIVNVVSAGNTGGSGCGSVSTPPGIYDETFSVGSTTSTDEISSFSSRGPVTSDGSNRLKPDITAPGSGVRSATNGGGYHFLNGTSMAAPHVAGLVALIISAEPQLAGRVDLIEQVIRDSATQLTSTQTCGDFAGNQIPNAVFGYGRIDAQAAISRALKLAEFSPTACAPTAIGAISTDPLTITQCVVLKNTGLLTLTQHTITDSLGNVSTFTQTILPGETYTFTKELLVTPPITLQSTWTATTPSQITQRTSLNEIIVTFYQYWFPIIFSPSGDLPTAFP